VGWYGVGGAMGAPHLELVEEACESAGPFGELEAIDELVFD